MYENIRKTRNKHWIIWIIIALVCLGVESLFNNVILKEKKEFIVCAPQDMESAFKKALKMADMNSEYKIVMTDDPANANVCVYYGNEEDVYMKPPCAWFKFAFSPFVVAYSYNYEKAFLKSDLIVENASFKNLYEISLTNLINAVLDEKNWSDYGVEGFKKVKVVYPDPSTIYWEDFYNLMLIAANSGKYPIDASEYNKAASLINSFIASDNTEAVVDFKEKVYLSGYFTEDILYIGPEKLFIDLNRNVTFFAPTETVHFNYYMQVDELGMKIIHHLEDKSYWEVTTFYSNLCYESYRSESYVELPNNFGYISGFRNVFNIVAIPEKENWKIEAE